MSGPTDVTYIAISDFKARCLQLASEVARTGRPLIVTRHGKPLVEINPVAAPPSLMGSVTQLVSDADLMAPLEAQWNVAP